MQLLPGFLRTKYKRMCSVFIPLQDGDVLYAPCFNHGGIYSEMADEIIVDNDLAPEAVGGHIIDCMARSQFKKQYNLSKYKESEWPSYKKSGMRSVKSFKRSYAQYTVTSANDANIIWVLKSQAISDQVNLETSVGMIRDSKAVGDSLLKLHDFYLKTLTL